LSTWKPVIENFKRKLSMWRGCMLSIASCICLIKSVLNSLLYIFFSYGKADMHINRKNTSHDLSFITLPSGDLKNQHALVSFWQILCPKWTLSWSVNKKHGLLLFFEIMRVYIKDLCNAKFCLGLFLQLRLKKSKRKEESFCLLISLTTSQQQKVVVVVFFFFFFLNFGVEFFFNF